MQASDLSLPQPDDVPELGEPPAIVEPPLRDMPPFDGLAVEDIEPVDDIRPYEHAFTSEALVAVRERALELDRVRSVLDRTRHVVVGVSVFDDKGRGDDDPHFALVAYSYDEGVAYEYWLQGGPDGVELVDIRQAEYHPPPSEEEVARAIAVAAADERIARQLDDHDEGRALLVSDVEEGDEHHGTRRFSVAFGPPDERLPRVHAIVDLGAEAVVALNAGRRS